MANQLDVVRTDAYNIKFGEYVIFRQNQSDQIEIIYVGYLVSQTYFEITRGGSENDNYFVDFIIKSNIPKPDHEANFCN